MIWIRLGDTDWSAQELVELVAARDADLWRMAQEHMRERAKKCCIVKARNGEDCYDTNEVDVYERISRLPLDPLPAEGKHE